MLWKGVTEKKKKAVVGKTWTLDFLGKEFNVLTLQLFVHGFDRNVTQVFLYTKAFKLCREWTKVGSDLNNKLDVAR